MMMWSYVSWDRRSMTRFVEDQLTVIILTNQDSKPWDICKDVAVLVDPAFGD